MKTSTYENVAKFFYDCGKVAFTVFIVGALTKKPILWINLGGGIIFTLLLVLTAFTMERIQEE